MVLNWNPDNFINLILSLASLFGALFLFRKFTPPNIKGISYLRFAWISGFLFFLFEGLSSLLSESLFSRISGVMTLFIAIFLIMAVNYSLNESYTAFIFPALVGLGTLSIYLAFQPDSILPILVEGYFVFKWIGLFLILNYFSIFLSLLFFLFWLIRIHKNAPFEIKRESNYLLLGGVFTSILALVLNLIYFWIPIFLLFANSNFLIGFIIVTYSIRKEPKLLFVLPFKPYRVIVMNHKGNLLYQHLWSQSGMNESKVAQYLGLIQGTPNEGRSMEGVLEIHLKEGVIICCELEAVRVGLMVSKASKLLRELLAKFTEEFERKFKGPLGAASVNPVDFESATELIEKYFSIFPSRLIDEKKKPLFLSKKVYKMPPALEAKLRAIVKDEKEFDLIRCEIQRSGENELPNKFLALYEELKDAMTEEGEENTQKKVKSKED